MYPSDDVIDKFVNAAGKNDQETVLELIKTYGKTIIHAEKKYISPAFALNNAAQNGHMEMVKLLLAHGANVNQEQNSPLNCSSALTVAARTGNAEMVEYLIEQGANIFKAPFICAVSRGHLGIAKKLVNEGYDPEELKNLSCMIAFYDGDQIAPEDVVPMLSFLVSIGFDVNTHDRFGHTPLHHATRAGREDIVAALFQFGAQYDGRNNQNETPFEHNDKYKEKLAPLFEKARVKAVVEKLGAGKSKTVSTPRRALKPSVKNRENP